MKNIRKLNWEEFDGLIQKLADWTREQDIKNIYGIPRGGLVVAVALSHKTNLPLTNDPVKASTLIVDDIIDEGHTMSDYLHYDTAALFCRCHRTQFTPQLFIVDAKNDFIIFPWETEESAKVDYLEGTT